MDLVHDFLSVFNLTYSSSSNEIYDKKNNSVGTLRYIFSNSTMKIKICAELEKSYLEAEMIFLNPDEKDWYIDYTLKSKFKQSKLSARITSSYHEVSDKVNHVVGIENGKKILKCKLNGKNGSYFLEFCDEGERLEITKKYFKHFYDFDFSSTKIDIENNDFIYSAEHEYDDDIYGYKRVKYEDFDDEIAKVVPEIDLEYEYFIDEVRKYFDSFSDNLYDNLLLYTYDAKYNKRVDLVSSKVLKQHR